MRLNWHTTFLYVPIAVGLLNILLYVVPARFRWKGTILASVFILLASVKFICYHFLGANMFNPEFPDRLIWAFNVLSAGATILLPLAFAADVAWLIAWLCGLRTLLVRRVYRVLLPLAAWMLGAVGVWNGVRLPAVREIEIASPRIPRSLDGYRIVQVADLHVSSATRRWRTEGVVRQANAVGADLILLTGDYADGLVANRGTDVLPLKDLRAKDGVYAVTGNHEYYLDAEHWRDFYRRNGFVFLHNAGVRVRPGLYVGGVNDSTGARRRQKKFDPTWDAAPNVRAALAGARKGDYRVLLCHNPKRANVNIEGWGADLQLSGHTHGGIAPILKTLVANHNDGFVRGLYRIGKGLLYVSPGTGQWTGFPIRFFNRSEITVFTLHPSESRAANPR